MAFNRWPDSFPSDPTLTPPREEEYRNEDICIKCDGPLDIDSYRQCLCSRCPHCETILEEYEQSDTGWCSYCQIFIEGVIISHF